MNHQLCSMRLLPPAITQLTLALRKNGSSVKNRKHPVRFNYIFHQFRGPLSLSLPFSPRTTLCLWLPPLCRSNMSFSSASRHFNRGVNWCFYAPPNWTKNVFTLTQMPCYVLPCDTPRLLKTESNGWCLTYEDSFFLIILLILNTTVGIRLAKYIFSLSFRFHFWMKLNLLFNFFFTRGRLFCFFSHLTLSYSLNLLSGGWSEITLSLWLTAQMLSDESMICICLESCSQSSKPKWEASLCVCVCVLNAWLQPSQECVGVHQLPHLLIKGELRRDHLLSR